MKLRPLLSALLASGLAAGAQAATVLSDDFETGQINGGSTQYTLVPPGTFTSPGDYGVVSDPSVAWANGFAQQFDHTVGTADGHMLFFDGAPSASTEIWSETAQLTAGTSYSFTYYNVWNQALAPRPGGGTYAAGGNPDAPLTQLLIDGSTAGGSLEAISGSWSGATYTFTAGHSGAFKFSIVDLNTQGDMNDGGLDDIRLVTSVPEPGSSALLLAGLGGLAVFARRRRQG